jgi:predicted RNase H-like HicB family nuclease
MAETTVSEHYPATVFWSDDDAGFIATAPDLPGSSAFGETQAEALAELDKAIAAWIEAARAAGNPIPAPTRPTVDAQPSGKLLVRMPKSLHAVLIQSAKRENVSLNQYVVYLLTTAATRRVFTFVIDEAHGTTARAFVWSRPIEQLHTTVPAALTFTGSLDTARFVMAPRAQLTGPSHG